MTLQYSRRLPFCVQKCFFFQTNASAVRVCAAVRARTISVLSPVPALLDARALTVVSHYSFTISLLDICIRIAVKSLQRSSVRRLLLWLIDHPLFFCAFQPLYLSNLDYSFFACFFVSENDENEKFKAKIKQRNRKCLTATCLSL